MINQPQIETCRKLATLMEQKGVKWEWEEDEDYDPCEQFAYYNPELKGWFPGSGDNARHFNHLDYGDNKTFQLIPIPTFSRCVEVLRKWGWKFIKLEEVRIVSDSEDTGYEGLVILIQPLDENCGAKFIEAQDPDHAGQLALLEAVERMAERGGG